MATKENIRTRTARSKLKHQNEPYWESLNRGLHIGYRTSTVGPGSWVGRLYHNKRYHHVTLDEFPEFADAKTMVEDWAKGIVNGALLPVEERKPETVEEACRRYVEERRTRKGKRTAYDASNRFERLVYGKPIGRIRLMRRFIEGNGRNASQPSGLFEHNPESALCVAGRATPKRGESFRAATRSTNFFI
ncbi:hypothetical protein [Burkholderia multivorans]|uniref:hypothetical protein n=1 Tax=Burkholderia multivorans TaxID=87883 RepID=UPI0011B279AB|nr:hypothetical protein [Burkholderia multivorans]MDN7999449.1 hypothetical protein [Burkholderia multivorans]